MVAVGRSGLTQWAGLGANGPEFESHASLPATKPSLSSQGRYFLAGLFLARVCTGDLRGWGGGAAVVTSQGGVRPHWLQRKRRRAGRSALSG